MEFFLRSNLDLATIQKIWLLADFERDRTLDRDEFVIAFHLIRLKRKYPNMPIPVQCPPELVPLNKQQNRQQNRQSLTMSPPPFQQQGPISPHGFNQPVMSTNFGGMGGMSTSPTFQTVTPVVRSQSTNFTPITNVPNFTGQNINARQVEMQVNQLLDQSRILDDQLFPQKQQTEQLRHQIEQLRLQHSDLELKIANQKQDLEAVQQERNQLNQEQATLRSKIDMLGHEAQGMQMQIQALKQEVLRLEGLKERASDEDNRQNGILQTIQAELQQNVQQLISVREELVAGLNRQNEFNNQKELQEHEVESKRQELIDLKRQLINKQSAIQQLESDFSALQATKRELENSSRNVSSELHQLDSEYAHLSQQVQDMQADVQQQQKKGGSNAKLFKLRELLNKAHQFVEEYYKCAQQDFPDQSHQPLSTTPKTPVTVSPTKSTPVVQPKPVTPQHDFGFDDEFDHSGFTEDFGATTTKVTSPLPPVVAKQISPNIPSPTIKSPVLDTIVTKTVSPAFEDDEFHVDFGDDDGFGVQSPPQPTQIKTAPVALPPAQVQDEWGFESPKPQAKSNDAFDDFTQTNSNNTSAWGDDFGW
jgi:predicted  nucleic acid-binding Zn-ribbon protein